MNARTPQQVSDLRELALEIEILDGDKRLAYQIMDQTKVIIGRILSADFRIADQRISRIHALLERQDDGTLKLTDLASTHGTFVNGERIIEKIIAPGSDDVQLANLKVKLQYVRNQATSPNLGAEVAKSAAVASTPPPPAAAIPATRAAPVPGPGGTELEAQVQVGQPKVRHAEPTVIRSLKETARTRGVLESSGLNEELEVTVYWEETILAVDHYKRTANKTISIGDAPGNTFIVPSGAVSGKHEFIRVRGQTAEIVLTPGMKGSARVQGRMQALDDLLRNGQSTITLSGQDIAKIKVGSVNFFLMFVAEPPAIGRDKVFDQGGLFWGIYASLTVLLVLAGTLGHMYKQPIEGQVKEIPERLRKILVEEYKKQQVAKIENVEVNQPPPELKPPPPKKDPPKVEGTVAKKAETVPDAQMVTKTAQRGGNEGEGMKERGKEGKRGWPNSKFETGITNRPKVPGATKTFDGQRKTTKPDAGPGAGGGAKASLMDSLRNTGLGAQLTKVAGGGGGGAAGGAQGRDPLDVALLGVGGGGIRSGRGSGGSGLQGDGTGGGGTAVGVGGLGSKGFGGGAKGDGEGSIPGKGEFVIGTESAEVVIGSGLSREEIERVVNAHRNEIQFCYSRELQRNPGLAGKLLIQWSIGDGGRVNNIRKRENTTGSIALENCVRDKLSRWIFPTPPGGGEVVVDWPWTFKPQGL